MKILKVTLYGLIWFFSLYLVSCNDNSLVESSETADLLERLNDLDGVEAREIMPYYGYPRAFEIDITQPVDHDNPNSDKFTQRAYLSHVDESMPMIFAPSGYGTTERSGQEIAGILQTNCLNVTHRFFEGSRPSPMDWSYLTVRQSAADHHRIVSIFKKIYSEKWISSGASKSGETVLFHRRFYPDDVDATIAYVAPLLFSDEDERFIPFLASVGSEESRNAVLQFQRFLLQNRNDLLNEFSNWFGRNGFVCSLPMGVTYESNVISYPWSYWQRHNYHYTEIPDSLASPNEVINHLAEAVRLQNDSDSRREYFAPYVYQAFTEIGYPAINTDDLSDLLIEDAVDIKEAYFPGENIEFVYKPETVQDVLQWLQSEGDNIIYIYGEVDPWTAGAVELTGQNQRHKDHPTGR